jgi:hypothetical protein
LIAYLLEIKWKVGIYAALALVGFLVILTLSQPGLIELPFITGNNVMPTLGVILFLLFGLIKNKDLTSIWLLFGVLFILSSTVVLPPSAHRYSYWLIDPGFINSVVVLPLTVLAGLGLSSWAQDKKIFPVALMGILLAVLMIVNAGERISFLPREETNYSSLDDLVAFEWIKDQLPADGTIFISGRRRLGEWEGQDSGIWIAPLTGMRTKFQMTDSNWCDLDFQTVICRENHEETDLYIYRGQMENSFYISEKQLCPGIESVLSFPRSSIYQLTCGQIKE